MASASSRPKGFQSKLKNLRADAEVIKGSGKAGLLAATGGYGMAGVGFRGSAGIPVAGRGNTLMNMQKFRTDFGRLDLKALMKTCRYVSETNWFGTRVCEVRKTFYGLGAELGSSDQRDWAKGGEYPFMDVVDDVMDEFVVTENVVVMWRVNSGNELPYLTVLNAEDVDYVNDNGFERLNFIYPRNHCSEANFERYVACYGEKMASMMRKGGKHEIVKGDEDWDFEFLGKGKRGCMKRPAMTGVLDDLDYVEMHKVADWNGAWKRKDILLHAKKGYALKSGSGSGRPVGNATKLQLDALSKGLSEGSGTSTAATNHDVELNYFTMASEFFGEKVSLAAVRRLVNWGGFAAIMLMDGFSQANGVSPYMMNLLRVETQYARGKVGRFLGKIFNNPTFLGTVRPPEKLTLQFNEEALYTSAEFVERVRFVLTQGVAAPETVRESMGYDSEREGDRLEAAHKERERYAPVFEAKQGLLPGLFPELEGSGSKGGGDDENKGGRPAKI